MGAGMSDDAPIFSKRSRVSRYVRQRMENFDLDQWNNDMERFDLDLSRVFVSNDQRLLVPEEDEVEVVLRRMGKFKPEDELNCGACGYDTCREHAIAILKGLAESEMCLPHTIDQLRSTIKELAVSSEQLADAQHALVQSEKLASMGQLAAGIAHEVNNPLGVVLMYAHLLLDEAAPDTPFREDLTMISEQADRCKKIVAGLLHFARQNKVVLTKVNMKELIEHVLHLMAFSPNVTTEIRIETDDLNVELDADQIQQVLTNLITNAIAAMPDGGHLTFTITGDEHTIAFSVADTGVGISEENKSKIFEPFFTTKQMGKGTGLGLAVSYGIVKMHRGDITMKSNNNPENGPTGTTFTVTLPRQAKQEKM
jgi:signal transduction histidine kinase